MALNSGQRLVLDYSAAERRRDWGAIVRRVCKWSIGIALLSTVVLLTIHTVRQSIEILRERALLNAAPAAGVVVFSDRPTDSLDSAKTASGNVSAIQRVIGFDSLGAPDKQGLVLAARLHSPAGREAIVVAQAYRSMFSSITNDTVPTLEVWIVEPTTLQSKRHVYPAHYPPFTLVRSLEEAGKQASISAATLDPGDRSHASFVVTIDDERRTYDLWLRDGGSRAMELSVKVEEQRPQKQLNQN